MTAGLAILNQTGKQCFLKCLMNMGTLKRLENIIYMFFGYIAFVSFALCYSSNVRSHEHLICNGMLLPVIV